MVPSTVTPMADEFYEKYKYLSHRELYRMLQAGMPRQVDGVGDTWASVGSTLAGLADTMRQDIGRLLGAFSGDASQEVLEGLGALAQRAKALAEEATAMRAGLTAMSQALAVTQRQAEEPQEVAAVAAEAVGSVLGAEVGHVPTAEDLAKARERMVWLVARLAAQYGVAEHANWPVAAELSSAIIGGAVTTAVQDRGHGHGHHHHGTVLQGTDVLRHNNRPVPHLASTPLSGQNPLLPQNLTHTSAEAAGVLRGAGSAPRSGSTPNVHVVGGTPAAAAPVHTPDGPAATTAAAAPPPPLGLGAGGMTASGSVIGGPATSAGLGAPAGLDSRLAAEVTWQTADNVEWIDPDDAAPSVIGG
jgi:hypothetical protein